MKRTLILLMALMLSTVACSKKSGHNVGPGPSPSGTPPPPGGGGTPIPPVYNTGATADMTIDMSVFDEYTGRMPNAPSNFKINVDLRDVDTTSGEAYGGTVKISYQEIDSSGNPIYYQGTFVSGNTVSEARYNKYVNHQSGQHFKAFFEDLMGGIIIVADSIDEFGDWNGKVYFKNFQCGRGPYDPPCNWERPRRCWLVSMGPYDCADYKVGGTIRDPFDNDFIIWNMNMSSRVYPAEYTRLGSFTGLDSDKALNK